MFVRLQGNSSQAAFHRAECAYYQEPEGKIKKAIQKQTPKPVPLAPPTARPPTTPCSEPVLEHVQRVSLMEDRLSAARDFDDALAGLRQHRMARRRRIDQAVDWLNANPP